MFTTKIAHVQEGLKLNAYIWREYKMFNIFLHYPKQLIFSAAFIWLITDTKISTVPCLHNVSGRHLHCFNDVVN